MSTTIEDLRPGTTFQLCDSSPDPDGVITRWLRTNGGSPHPETYRPRIACVRLDTGQLLNIVADWEVFRVEDADTGQRL